MTLNEHRLRISGELAQIPNACSWVVRVAETVGLDMRAMNHLELAVDEAVTNIIEHGYGSGGAEMNIDIIVTQAGGVFKVTIVDEGPPFNPLQMNDPNPETPLEERGGGGWGVFFIKKLMDTVDYQYVSNRNHLIMTKQIG